MQGKKPANAPQDVRPRQAEATSRPSSAPGGLRESMAKTLLMLVELKFGPVPSALRKKVEDAPLEMLQTWNTRILSANRLSQVFRDRD